MARVQGVKEKLHSPLYDAFFVPGRNNGGASGEKTFEEVMKERDPRMIRFFVDVQNKTRLETNLQASGVLPSQNAFEARAMRVVVSSLRKETNPGPEFMQESNFMAELIYSSVTSLLVGEKVMIEMPTFYFPAGAGVQGVGLTVQNHGDPDPLATFRFAEPVLIEPQQNFRVEMLFPQGLPDPAVAKVKGPLRIWVVLDGYLTRDVQ
jgi:hypothetical protein